MNNQLLKQIEKSTDYLIIVEGEKDASALKQLGFNRIFILNETGKSLGEKIEQIQNNCTKKDKVCILTDFDKTGRQLYLLLKSKLNELGVKMDNSLRRTLLKERISHIEGLDNYLKNQEIKDGKANKKDR